MNNLVQGFKKSLSAVRANILPGSLLVLFAVIIILSYQYINEVKFIFSFLKELKLKYGYVFSFFSTALFGGTFPFLFELILNRQAVKSKLKSFLFVHIFWAIKGLEIDFFYRLQAVIFGNNNDFFTVLFKTLADQFIYCAFWAVPVMVILYNYRDRNFKLQGIYHELRPYFFTKRVLPVLLSNWLVWIPAVIVIYNLPLELQLPIQNIILCFWSLLLSFLSRKSA